MAGSPIPSAAFATSVLRIGAARFEPIVVKLGGSAMEDPAATSACLQSVAALHRLGLPLVLVHGGGKPIDRAMAEAGLTPRKVAGRRYTDDATLAIVVRVLSDEINAGLEKQLQALGADAISVHKLLEGERLTLPDEDGEPVDLGSVGRVTRVDDRRLHTLLHERKLPVIPCLGIDSEGRWLNVNADTAAAAIAGAIRAARAIFLTDTPGVLRNRSEPGSLMARLSEVECREWIASGIIEGGMVPKVEACFEALAAGAKAALILDGRVPFSLLDVFLHETFTGTEITR